MPEESNLELLKWDIEQSLEHIRNFKSNAVNLLGISGIVFAIISSFNQLSATSKTLKSTAIAYFISFFVMLIILVYFYFPKEALHEKKQRIFAKRKAPQLSTNYIINYRKTLREKALPKNAHFFIAMTITFAINMLLGIMVVLLIFLN
ncbi:MAG: hypothetical protein ACTSQE_04750 [Candidatus Heimdallarchaeaceae archaeon]